VTTVRVHLDEPDGTRLVGTAHIRRLRGVDTTEFTYDDAFLSGPAWDLSPDIPIGVRSVIVEGLPGALADSTPDTWGRNLISRRLAALARRAGHVAPTPTEADYLLGVADIARPGALRLCLQDGQPFLAEGAEVPQLIDLQALLVAARRVAEGSDEDSGSTDDAVESLLAAGSGSLGGARPKASITDGVALFIAKFPHPADRWNVIRWEAVALDLATAAGLRTPPYRLIEIGRDAVLLVWRFDRDGSRRVPYLSARSLVEARSVAGGDYLDLVDGLTAHGSDVVADLAELWARIAFSIAINNVDDHLQNHGFLRQGGGWKLSPLFDVNPDPRPGVPRASSLAGTATAEESLDALFSTSAHFGVAPPDAASRWRELRDVVGGWRGVASARGIPPAEQEEFASVLDHGV
jgi:serine/threonine-protein kinase HipA